MPMSHSGMSGDRVFALLQTGLVIGIFNNEISIYELQYLFLLTICQDAGHCSASSPGQRQISWLHIHLHSKCKIKPGTWEFKDYGNYGSVM